MVLPLSGGRRGGSLSCTPTWSAYRIYRRSFSSGSVRLMPFLAPHQQAVRHMSLLSRSCAVEFASERCYKTLEIFTMTISWLQHVPVLFDLLTFAVLKCEAPPALRGQKRD